MTSVQAPDFIIVGTQKGGTTSLYKFMIQHPDIMAASTKEIHFFTRYYDKGEDWYLSHFPVRMPGKLSGEASPFYLFHPTAAERIAKHFPNTKIIMLLRNPAQRAISHYHQQFRREKETLGMMEAFEAEPGRIEEPFQKIAHGEQKSGNAVQQFSYLKRGLYLEQIKRYQALFPAENIHIASSEAFFEDPCAILSGVFQFLGVDATFQPKDLWPRKPGGYQEVESDIRSFLDSYFAEANKALYQHLGVDFHW